MSTKPTTLARWATNLTNNDEPSSGQKDTGWTPGQGAVSDYDNWVKYWNYKWTEWLSDGDVNFNTIILNRQVQATITPIAEFKDWTDRRRFVVDHNGFPMGQLGIIQETWFINDASATVLPPGWAITKTASSAWAINAPSEHTLNTRYLFMSMDGASANVELASEQYVWPHADINILVEFDVMPRNTLDPGDAPQWEFVLIANGGTDRVGFFVDLDTNANWMARQRVGGVTTDTSTGVAAAIDTTYRMRFEITGDNLHSGSDFLLRWYVNGTKVHEATAALSALAYFLRFRGDVGTDPPAAAPAVRIGRIRSVWNLRLNADQL